MPLTKYTPCSTPTSFTTEGSAYGIGIKEAKELHFHIKNYQYKINNNRKKGSTTYG
ncbi:hypothetical protein NEI00_03580 [Brachyspira pilosicoli]|uniref:hypothetical protein n=1 Tax=Brachyspira pilosicoli TaxID=52584 RepID=UPI002543C824|nr:hypothetical protein [Brachyspira pilosicoli]WIH84276.1 hypothetical protein NEI00_03580 [Brachyspira pilosicoli]